jgi:hypothetical protein
MHDETMENFEDGIAQFGISKDVIDNIHHEETI